MSVFGVWAFWPAGRTWRWQVIEAQWWEWVLSLMVVAGPFALAGWYFRGQASKWKTLSDAYEKAAWLSSVKLFEAGLKPDLWRIHEDGTMFTAAEIRQLKGLGEARYETAD